MTDRDRVGAVARSGASVWWLNAILGHRVAPDEGVRHLAGSVQWGADVPTTWLLAVGTLRTTGIDAMRLVVVTAGDPLGLPGPVEVTRAAVAAGMAVVSSDGRWTLVPISDTDRWRGLASGGLAATASPLGSPGEARSLMRTAMAELTASFTSLDPDDEALAELTSLRALEPLPAPDCVDPRTAQLADTALRVWWLAGIAERLCGRRSLDTPDQVRRLEPLARRAIGVAFSEVPR